MAIEHFEPPWPVRAGEAVAHCPIRDVPAAGAQPVDGSDGEGRILRLMEAKQWHP